MTVTSHGRRAAILALLWSCVVACAVAQPAGGDGRGELLLATRRFHDAQASGDESRLDSLLAPEYSGTDSRGRVRGRADLLAAARRRDVDLEETISELSDLRVTVVRDTGVVSGLAEDRLSFHGRLETRRRRFTEVWLRGTGGWTLIASHESGADLQRRSVSPSSSPR
jgi:hypothetical protein